jgi:7,8-dihydropterin-6-yl-methyl-4-(beta-D-ribofuranosyl)aminobenzene 5'-phosphate synthase
MIKKLRITIICDNHSRQTDLKTDHGLAFWIEADNTRILFDTGQVDSLQTNAAVLGIELSSADFIVLSHGHYDHTGGLDYAISRAPNAEIYCHPDVIIPRFSLHPDNSIHSIGITDASKMALSKSSTVKWVTNSTAITESIFLTGPIPRKTRFENTGGLFFLDEQLKEQDLIEDDCAVWIKTASGLIVLTGCCHSGLVNTLDYISDLSKGTSVDTVMGGFHLLKASKERLNATCDYLFDAGIRRIVPCHCTGDAAVESLEKRFGNKVIRGTAGLCVDLPDR